MEAYVGTGAFWNDAGTARDSQGIIGTTWDGVRWLGTMWDG